MRSQCLRHLGVERKDTGRVQTRPAAKEAVTDLICLTVDVEWAAPEVLMDLVGLLNERKLSATFFCTHEGINLPGHERAIHPSFRRMKKKCGGIANEEAGSDPLDSSDFVFYRRVVEKAHSFCREAIGARAHALLSGSDLLPIYQAAGLQYDSSCFLPLLPYLAPVLRECDVIEMPIYYMDHFDLIAQASGFRLSDLHLDRPGLKVFDFHPNMVYINASRNEQYLESKPWYHSPEKLLMLRRAGRGVRTLFLDLVDLVAARGLPTATLRELNSTCRDTWK
jgi:hypothetical protein